MATKEVTVTVTMDDTEWAQLCDAAECAGMSVPDYLAHSARLVALHPRMARPLRVPRDLPQRGASQDDDSETAAWTESFSQRLHHRTDVFRND
ncbi:hypothetical protein ACIHDR_33560 [Nocardia sp. NPDC052278]|uniref:hypothetical protein n=1 Tax=unclassified Nocardia TaxID=2637762 RepID=UPI0036A74947